jgi:ribonuclease P protein component
VPHEKNLATQSYQAAPPARIPEAHENRHGPGRVEASSREGPEAALREGRWKVSIIAQKAKRASAASFGRGRRLLQSWQFRKFFGKNEVFRLAECVVFRIPNELGHFRLGVTLKARGSSVERNKVKRAIRESFRTQAALLGSHDYNVVVPAHKKMAHPYHLKLGRCLREELPRVLKPKRSA